MPTVWTVFVKVAAISSVFAGQLSSPEVSAISTSATTHVRRHGFFRTEGTCSFPQKFFSSNEIAELRHRVAA
jgi:hypothetical protein